MQTLVIVHLHGISALKKSRNKIKNIQKRALRLLLNDYSSDYETLISTRNFQSL